MNHRSIGLSSAPPAFRAVLLPGMLLAALVGMIAVLLQGYMMTLQEQEEARAGLVRIGQSTVPSLERALWDVNDPQVDVLLDGIAQSNGVRSVVLLDEQGRIRTRGASPEPGALEERYALALDGAEGIPLGELRVALDAGIGFERAKGRVIRGAFVLIVTFLIGIAVLVELMNRRLVHPLNRLVAGIEAYSPDRDVPPSGRTSDDALSETREVQMLAEALDLMHLRIRHDTVEIESLSVVVENQQDRMAAVVQQRTAELEEKNLQLATQAAGLERLANTDALTGAASRRKLIELGERECARSLRDGRPVAVLAIDIDHFKSVNDSHGHAGGDFVLKVVVVSCQSQLRNNDVLGRLGGEEFAVLLPGAGTAEAGLVAERIRQRIEATPVVLGEQQVRVTVSIGAASSDGSVAFEALLAIADDALYSAKRGGRNRVVAAGDA